MARNTTETYFRSFGWDPNDSLKALFGSFGRLALRKRSQDGALLTTRLFLFAVAEVGARRREPTSEASMLARLSGLLRRNASLFDRASEEYFLRPEESVADTRLRTPGFSPNFVGLMDAAIKEARARHPDTKTLTAADVLRVFPPEGSKARKLFSALEVDPGEFQKIVRAKNERVSTHADEPANYDELGRQAFADILADRIREARESSVGDEPSAFIVHLHGPWGSGKSSVLNFLEANLSDGSKPWIVVWFNAWRDQRLQPPWWRLITTIYYGARAKLGWRAPWLWLRWMWWRVRADYLPVIAVLLFGALLMLTFLKFGWLAHQGDKKDEAGWMGVIKNVAPWGVTLITAIYVGSRTLAFGSRRAAQTYADLKDDPFRPIAKLFNDLVDAIDRPLVVFIDDLDRCDSKYVVELLEGIQTLMRGAAVCYVVAADRKWICSSFEQRYGGFSPPIGESGRPLGYLFLDKLFQVSAAIPQIPADIQSTYWARLLSPEQHDPRAASGKREAARQQAEATVADLSRQEELQSAVKKAEATGDPELIQATRAACARRITSPDAAVGNEHRLEAFAELLEPNPRAMKRLVNAFAMHQATLLLAGRDTPAGPLARWTILELRWPLLADFLAARPECVDALRHRLQAEDLPQIPAGLRCLFGDELVEQVVGDADDEERLTTAAVRSILGAVQGDR